jgi:hypothetical protein
MTVFQEQNFNTRLKESDIWTKQLVEFLKEIGHFEDYRKATREEDERLLIDYWCKYSYMKEFVPVGFKLRVEHSKRDIPVLYSQPFHGIDSETTVSGRDYRCLKQSVQQYYVGVKDESNQYREVYRVSKHKLLPHVESVIDSWQSESEDYGSLIPYNKMTAEKNKVLLKKANGFKKVQTVWRHEGTEVWWQKNPDRVEKSPKINLYIPENFKEESFKINDLQYAKILEGYNRDKETEMLARQS